MTNDKVKEALEAAKEALATWVNTYAPELCNTDDVAAANKRLEEGGTLYYIANANKLVCDAIAAQPAQSKSVLKRLAVQMERNFCERCGKRVFEGSIHTCTSPSEPAQDGLTDDLSDDEQLIAWLRADAAKLMQANPGDEMATTMLLAASRIYAISRAHTAPAIDGAQYKEKVRTAITEIYQAMWASYERDRRILSMDLDLVHEHIRLLGLGGCLDAAIAGKGKP